MESLPDELLSDVVKACDFASQKNLRPVTKRLERIASEFVFQDIHMILLPEYLQKWQSIASCRLANHVRSATIYLERFLPKPFQWYLEWINAEQWDRWLKHMGYFPRPDEDDPMDIKRGERFRESEFFMPKEVVEPMWQKLDRLREQYELWQPEQDGQCLLKTLCQFPHLQDIGAESMIEYWRDRVDPNTLPIWNRIYQETHFRPETFYRCENAAAAELDLSREERAEPERRSFDISERTMASALQVMAYRYEHYPDQPITRLHKLHCYRNSLKSNFQDLNNTTIEESYTNMFAAFNNITDLSIYVERHAFRDSEQSRHELDKVLRNLRGIQHLKLDFNTADHGKIKGCILPIFDSARQDEQLPVYWTSIESLSLSRIAISSKSLLSFFARHASTIKDLSLNGMWITDAPHLLKEIPHVLKLEKANVAGCYSYGPGLPRYAKSADSDRGFRRKMLEYLVGKREEMPDWATRSVNNGILDDMGS